MKGNSNPSLNNSDNINIKEKLNNKQYPKVTFNLIEKIHILKILIKK